MLSNTVNQFAVLTILGKLQNSNNQQPTELAAAVLGYSASCLKLGAMHGIMIVEGLLQCLILLAHAFKPCLFQMISPSG